MGQTPVQAQPLFAPNSDVYAVFCSSIDQGSVARIFAAVAVAIGGQAGALHVLFQSTGGMVADGVCLFNFFRALNVSLALYNVGSVQSIAAVAYLGAAHRKVSSKGVFSFHRTTVSPQAANAVALKSSVKLVATEDARTQQILAENTHFGEEQWKILNEGDLILTADEAIQLGVATEVGEFAPPPGARIFNI